MDTAEDFLLRYFLGEKDMLGNKEVGNKGGEQVNKERIMQEDTFVCIDISTSVHFKFIIVCLDSILP